MLLRPMLDGDIAAVLAVEAAATAFPWSRAQFVDSLRAQDDATVVEVDDQVVGFALFKRVVDEATLLNIAVHPDYQGRGYGRALLVQGLAAQAGKGVLRCLLEVRVSNDGAQALYRSLGFMPVGDRKNYYPAPQGREHAVVMARELPDNALGEV